MSDKPESKIKQDAQIKQDKTFVNMSFSNEEPKIILKSINTRPIPLNSDNAVDGKGKKLNTKSEEIA